MVNFLDRYRQIFHFDTNHADEEVAIEMRGERVLFHVEMRDESYQAGMIYT